MFTGKVAVAIARPIDEVFASSRTPEPVGPMLLMQPLVARGIQRNLDSGFARLQAMLDSGADDSVRGGRS